MVKNRLVNIMLIILITLTLIGVLATVLYTQVFQETRAEGEPTIDDILKVSVETEEITTNLLSNHIIRTQFVIQLDNDDAVNEFQKRDFQVENIIIQELSDMRESDFRGSEGIVKMQNGIKKRINEIMQSGEVVEVYMNKRMIQ
ncbi:flagellar basal body-associated protein FliL [Evansella cellulosilytica]|uniref:Flagellar protein FliL n=1 Tax=Evansella cellulosilytica (strain ATCC 21833 / DSM 2522 / FERM P-1141 / JCM 9156 / N-4) TaxID=649639 RepID=E6TSV7_EVAC2|nr:flagellar basal body-associated protein FliL [Evansella cellulosilytica]ADU30749.1 flagellar basal body-associated protein FliL [Evansella cellulosilytica DSM 2522]